jgi:hypothetical protein
VSVASKPNTLPPSLVRFVELFNAGQHWESHEALEDLWREVSSDFLQGLILYASAFVHVRRGNRHGIGAQLSKAEEKLAPYGPRYLGVHVEDVLANIRRCQGVLLTHPLARPEDWPGLVSYPLLKVDVRWVKGDEPELAGAPPGRADEPDAPERGGLD